MRASLRSVLHVLLLLFAPVAAVRAQDAAASAIPGLEGIDHVAIGVNDVAGAVAAYDRLGFTVLPVAEPAEAGGAAAIVDLGGTYLELFGPTDSAGVKQPYTFEGALSEAWRVRDLDAALERLAERGATADEVRGGSIVTRLALPRPQPVAGTDVVLVEIDEQARDRLVNRLATAADLDPADHANGARDLAYVTIAVRRSEEPLKILKSWGFAPSDPVDDARGARLSAVDLPGAPLFVVTPTGGGGIADFVEERRAHAAPVGDRLYEGSILSLGVAVSDLDETIDFLDQRGIPHVPMELPRFGRTEVVQGAPGWGLRLEFVEAKAPGGAVESRGRSCSGEEACP